MTILISHCVLTEGPLLAARSTATPGRRSSPSIPTAKFNIFEGFASRIKYLGTEHWNDNDQEQIYFSPRKLGYLIHIHARDGVNSPILIVERGENVIR